MPTVLNYAEILSLLDALRWPKQNGGRSTSRGSRCFTLGCTLNARGSKNFEEALPSGKGVNRRIVPSKVDAALGQRLWDLMLAEGEALGYKFSSVQVNLNFPGKPHRDRSDPNHRWCCSLGEFAGGRLCWREGDVEYKRSTRNMWTKLDGRHLHWVEPYEGVRYSLVLFSCTDHPALPLYYQPARRRALVLFCGTGSIDRAFLRLGWDVVSVDTVSYTHLTLPTSDLV